ncbi:MAG: hypothetical protein ACFE9Q_13115 [Candidatus Hodarchaeota archaeon]
MIYNNPEEHMSEYEETINKLSDQIKDLFSKIHFYQALVAEKEHQISQLAKENQKLLAKIQELTYLSTPAPPPSQQSYTPPPPPNKHSYTPPVFPSRQPSISESIEDSRINKRVCPNCGAMGFAIREVDDKSKVISYTPRRMYAKKKACTKCRYEWS